MLRRPFLALFVVAATISCAQSRVEDVIYMKSGGAAFTLDVFKPANPNKAAVVWLVSGGWFSAHESIDPNVAKLFTDSGFTVFEVVHGSQPRYKIPEIVSQVRRAVRFVHSHASEYGIDPNRIGISGASAGGHLSLMVAGLADDGDPNAKDPVDRAASRVAAVGILFPPTDFLNYGAPNRMPFDDPMMAIFIPAFGVDVKGPKDKVLEVAKQTSPITYVNPKFPPTLIVHGDSDKLVPLQQGQEMDAALAKAGVPHSLIVVPGGGHDEKTWMPGMPKILEWFKAKLLP